jgi:branched-chain amino acid transport system permease protein
MAVFVGVGGYVSGLLSTTYELAVMVSLPAAMLAGFVFGGVFSALTLRLHHWFFSVATLALTVAAVSAVSTIDALGGGIGLMGIPLVDSPVLILAGLAVAFVVSWGIDASPLGAAMRATGDDEVLAQLFGVRVIRLRILVFAIGSALAALAGGLQAHRFGLYQPSDLGFQNSMLLFVYVLVGGKGSVFGPVLGTFFLFTVPELVNIAPETQLVVYGLMMILVGVAAPGGLAALLAQVGAGIRHRLGGTAPRARSAGRERHISAADPTP